MRDGMGMGMKMGRTGGVTSFSSRGQRKGDGAASVVLEFWSLDAGSSRPPIAAGTLFYPPPVARHSGQRPNSGHYRGSGSSDPRCRSGTSEFHLSTLSTTQ